MRQNRGIFMIEYPNNRTLNESGSGGCGDVNVPGPVGCRDKPTG